MQISPNLIMILASACILCTAAIVYVVIEEKSQVSSTYKQIPVMDRPEDCLRLPHLTDAEMSRCQRKAYFKKIPATPNDNKSF